MPQRRYNSFRLVALLIVCSLTGCATGSHRIAQPSAPPADLGLSAADANLSVSLHYLIITNGPGSWVENAPWDEYALTVMNLTDSPVIVGKISVLDPRGMFIDSEGNPAQLERKSSDLAAEYGKLGMSVAVGQAAAAAGVGGVFGPVSSLFGITRAHYQRQEQQEIRNEFNRRRLLNFRLSGHKSMSGSAFLPIVPDPKALIVNYRKGNEVGAVEISLEKFQRPPMKDEKGR
jgi:hypothetical protein